MELAPTQVPYSYFGIDKKWKPWGIDDEAAVVRQIFSLTMEGFGSFIFTWKCTTADAPFSTDLAGGH